MFSAVKLLTLFSHGPSPVHVRTLSRLPPSMSSIRAVSFNVGLATTQSQPGNSVRRERRSGLRRAHARARPALAPPMITMSYVFSGEMSGIEEDDSSGLGVVCVA